MTKTPLKDVKNKIIEFDWSIDRLLSLAKYDLYEDLSGIDYDDNDPEDLMLIDELQDMLSKLKDISHTISYLNRPIKKEGILRKTANGRYELNGHEFTCGSGIEYLTNDGRHSRYDENLNYTEVPYWCASRIEHNGSDYYLVGAPNDLVLDGLNVRIR